MGGGARVGRGGGDHYHSDSGLFMMVSNMTKEMKKTQTFVIIKMVMMVAMIKIMYNFGQKLPCYVLR